MTIGMLSRLGWITLSIASLAGLTRGGAGIQFRNIASEAGIDFVLNHHPTPDKHMIEIMPGGLAAFDYNSDGLTDLFFTNGAVIPSLEKESPKYFNRLYRNEGGMKFTDVTEQAGVAGAGYSMGAAAGDFNNDGHVDLFVAGVFRNLLYRNRGDGTFQDVTPASGITSDMWSVAAGWFDYDNNGWLDLIVINYAEWTPQWSRFCGDKERGIRVYCHPKYLTPLPNQLYRNLGNGRFEDVSDSSGIGRHRGRGMSVAFADYDSDGFMDVFVTNDNLPNFLFRNLGNGKFEETGLLAGAALLNHGKPVASMGADFRDYDNDGLADIVVTALTGETFPLFRNAGGLFEDATYQSRLGPLTAPCSGWGVGLFDLDNDGSKDLFTAGSHVNDRIELFEATQYKQPNRIFANRGDGTFEDVSNQVGKGFEIPRAHRGSVFADFNNDGKLDVVVASLGEPAELWENVSPANHGWLIVKLEGTRSNRDGIGARLRMMDQHNHMTTSVGYASSSHFGVHFGVGPRSRIERLELRWPSGTLQMIEDVPLNQVLKVRENSGPEPLTAR